MRGKKDVAYWQLQPPRGWKRTSFRRAALAHWMTDPQYGAGHLAARVIVNRLWQHHFGRGIVSTPNDFGAPGQPPTHPELLDWLAAKLIADGWRLKPLHKLMMTSSTYRQSDEFDPDRARLDRNNIYHWCRSPRRLEGEAIRDALLAVSGTLDKSMYGPGTLDQNMTRRSVYFSIKRSKLIPMMMLFDWPEHLVSIGQRTSTTTAPQSLMFMNSSHGSRYAAAFAERISQYLPAPVKDSKQEITAQQRYKRVIRQGFLLAFGRTPDHREAAAAAAFMKSQLRLYQTEAREDPQKLMLVDVCRSLMSMNEFVYVR